MSGRLHYGNFRVRIFGYGKRQLRLFTRFSHLPEFPTSRRGVFSPRIFNSSLRDPPKGTPIVLKHDDQWTLEIDFGDIQPQATIWEVDPVYVSARTPGSHRLSVRIYADNLSQTQEREIQLDFSMEQRPRLTLEYLDKFQEEYWKQREKELDDYE